MNELSVVESIFSKALEIKTPGELHAFLSQRCPNENIRRQVEQLLSVDANAGSFLAKPPEQLADSPPDFGVNIRIGSQVGPYKVREKIGEGGMGVVYVAEQDNPVRRKVALKVIKPGMDTKEVIARFEAERQALAVMAHPHIAGVLDVGATEQGRPYFAMELVRGIPITEYCDQARLGPRQRLRLFRDICDAVQHAHQKGIIHRDLKPSNVLVTQMNGKEVVKVIDFGLAKAIDNQRLTDKSLYTGFMRLMGTPAYMSPEQAGMSGLDVDTRSDVFSLGVLLYEMLTGTTPLDKGHWTSTDYEDLRRRIREVEPPKPSVRVSTLHNAQCSTIADQRRVSPHDLRQLLRGDLDRVVMQALQKDREQRYQTASEFSDDIRHYLEDKPVNAVSPSPLYVARKYAKRHRVLICTASGFALLLIATTAVSSGLAIQASRAEQRALLAQAQAGQDAEIARQEESKAVAAKQDAEASERRLRRLAYASDMNLTERELSRGNVLRARELLNRHRPNDNLAGPARKEDLRGWEWRYLWQFCQDDAYELLLDTRGHAVSRLSVSHNGRYLAVSCAGRVFVRDIIDNIAVSDFPGEHATFSPTEPILAFWSPDPADDGAGRFRLWSATSRKVVNNDLLALHRGVRGVAFSGDGSALVVSTADWNEHDANKLLLVNLADGKRSVFDAPQVGPGAGYPFALAGDLSIAAHGSGDARLGFVRVVELKTGNELWRSTAAPRGEWIECLALSPDNQLLAVGHGLAQPTVEIWDVDKRTKVGQLEGHSAYVRNVVFAGNRKLISSSADQTVRVWDLTDPTQVAQLRVLRGHEGEIGHVALLPDGQIISGCNRGRVIKWDLTATRDRKSATFRFDSHKMKWRVKPDQSALITCRQNGVVSEWTGDQYETERELFRLGPGFHRASVSLDATKLAVGRVNGDVELWDIDRQEPIQSFETGEGPMVPDQFYAHDQIVEVMHESWRGAKFLWDLRKNRKTYVWSHTSNLISLDGTAGVTFHDDRIEMTRFRGDPPEALPETWANSFPFGRVAISADGQYLATTHEDGQSALLFDLQHRKQIGAFGRGFMVGPSSVYFSPDNKRVIVGGASPYSVLVFDLETQQQVLALESVGDTRRWARFSPDGNIIMAQDESDIVHGWRAPSWEVIAAAEASSPAACVK